MTEMMPDFFIGREEQLALLGDLLGAPLGSRRVLLVHGPGGIGKTKLLQEIYKRQEEYVRLLGGPLLFTKTIDFDDISLRLILNVAQRIVEELGKEWFGDYLSARDTYIRFQFLKADPETLRAQLQRADRLFLECYNQLAQQKRILLLCDTMEVVQGTDVWRYLLGMADRLNNTVLILAGRKLDEVWSDLESRWGKDVVYFEELSPFVEEEAADYFARTDVGAGLDLEMRAKLYLLTAGHPILIALAIEWLRRDMPLDDITSRPLSELQTLDEQKLKQTREEFEVILVNKILELTIVDQAILRMAHVYLRFDDGILQYLLNLSETETRKMSTELRDFPFVKPRPREAYTLHDEMRRLVTKHCWPRVDPHETQRLDLSRRMVEYYDDLLAGKNENLHQLREQWEVARQKKDTDLGQELFRKLAELERQVSVLEVERFHYLLNADSRRAYNYFLEAFDKATLQYRYNFRELLWTEMQSNESEYAGEQRYQIGIRGVKFLLDETRYDESYQRAEILLSEYGDQNPVWQIDMLVQMANIDVRRGKTEESLGHFQEALNVCQKHKLTAWSGRVESGLGWIYRQMGKWKEAEQVYRSALEHSSAVGDMHRVAQVLNNLGYVRYLRGNLQSGLILCKQALSMWEEMGYLRWEGLAWSTMGEILTAIGKHKEALNAYDTALRIFGDQEDWEWMATTYHELARAKWHLAFEEVETPLEQREERLKEALQHAKWSLKLCEDYKLSKEFPVAYYRVGRIRLDLDELDEAERCFNKSYECSKELQDNFHFIISLASLAELAYAKGDNKGVKKRAKEAEKLIGERGLDYPLLYGRILRLLAQVYLDEGDYDPALDNYIEGLAQIGRHGGYGKYRLDRELEVLRERITKLPEKIASPWCDRFIERWQADKERAAEHPEVVTACRLAKLDLKQGTR